MSRQTDEIREGVQTVIDRLDILKGGKSVHEAFLIERGEDVLNDFLRYDLDLIEKAEGK